ncbi:MAG TPA: hypothetical protein DDY14_03050 [Chromatiaceae bacterium]|jgi:NAD(P)H-flavin reductase/ferredoxin|nr:MAG: hypothetical protein N838_21305 [Thiohalocapsa sp. PB-PSB1]QQO56703.1 MAG: 2Fe-2S iron-sulfur cluster binding domain-containing protein [Thiohalocapsa sp. PB-PSB1]HBG94306.1 hypothetical protein [Chromatiaceae bacterium]HCS91885.1 hypothetical protein [Chromatiaceae bacterium]
MTHSRSLSHHRVTLSDGTQFDVAPGQTLLQAALSAGLEWPNGCRVGLCGSCRCKITSGQVKALTDFSDVISQADLTQGHVLACRCQLESAIDVSSDELYGRLAPDDADIDATITHIDWVTPLVQLIEVELDHPHPHGYAGGQYTRLEVPGVVPPRCFSFANACRGDGRLRFLVRVFPGGRLGEWLSQEDRCGQRLRVGRPLGHFLFRDHHRPALFFAGGTGLAPILAMLEELASLPAAQHPQVRVVFAARDQQHLFHRRFLEPIVNRWAIGTSIDFVSVLSREPRPSSWKGLRGHFFEHLALLTAGFENADTYLCGPPGLVDAMKFYLVKRGFDRTRISADRFLPSTS